MVDQLKISWIQDTLRRAHIHNRSKRTGAEYWLCGPGLARICDLRILPDLIGLSWSYYEYDERAPPEDALLVVDFLDSDEHGEVDLLTWREIEALLTMSGRFIIKMSGFEFPLRVMVLPGNGVVLALEHLHEAEFASLHGAIIDAVIPHALGSIRTDPLLIACVTEEVYVNGLPEVLFSARRRDKEVVIAPDFLLTSSEMWARGQFVLGARQELLYVDGLTLVTTSVSGSEVDD